MIGVLKSLFRVKLMRIAQRFAANTPSNTYEGIVFDALRRAFTALGEAKHA